jgi:hypothetical protein
MDACEKGKLTMLIQDTERDIQTYLSSKQGSISTKQHAKIFNQKML